MTRQSHVLTVVAAGVFAFAALVTRGASGSEQAGVADAESVLRTFHERVESYAALHRCVAPPQTTTDRTVRESQWTCLTGTFNRPLSWLMSSNYLASAIRSERFAAQQGDLFSLEIAAAFRQWLADSIGERDGEEFLAELSEGEVVPRGIHPTVNEPYSMTRVFRMPPEVRSGLPALPAELDYRIAARDLVLWDIAAGIVVDFVPDAFVTRIVTEE